MPAFVPTFERIKERIRSEILDSELKGGSGRLPTERELQARYAVSRPTIGKALASLAAEGLIAKHQGRGTFALGGPCADAGAAQDSSHLIGFVAPLAGADLVQRAFRGIDRVAHRRRCRALMGNSGGEVARERLAVMELISTGVRGLVIYPNSRRTDDPDTDYLTHESFGVPIVLVDTCEPRQGHVQVVFDNHRAGYAMTTWLIGRGHRRIAIVTTPEYLRHPSLLSRLDGHTAALRDHGLSLDPDLIGRYPVGAGIRERTAVVDRWLAMPSPPTAIVGLEDTEAMELTDYLFSRSVRVPEDIQVVGFDNLLTARRFRPAFATTSPDFERMGEIACNLLLDAIETGVTIPRTYVLDVPLVLRRVHEAHGPGSRDTHTRFGARAGDDRLAAEPA